MSNFRILSNGMYLGKKAVSELTSFVLLTLLIVLASSSAYVFSQNFIDDNVILLDRDKMDSYLIDFVEKSDSIMNFDGSQVVVNLDFNKGELIFYNNQVKYQSLVEFSGDLSCFASICSFEQNGFELLYFNLSNSYNFHQNVTLGPGSYKIVLLNLKNESKIKIKLS